MNKLYENPVKNVALSDCWFYHTFELPDIGLINGHWDLRGIESSYLGGLDLNGKKVLEVGPASGYLTAYMDHAGAEVTAVEQPDDDVWDFVPYCVHDSNLWNEIEKNKRRVNQQVKNAFWYVHEKLKLRAKMHCGRMAELPEELGKFDVAVLAMVLTHMRDPIKAIMECARRTDGQLVVVDRTHVSSDLQQKPVMQLIPDANNKRYDSWWYFSKGFFLQLFSLMGFRDVRVSPCDCTVKGKSYRVTVFVATW